MATGLIGTTNGVNLWRILEARTSNNNAPSGASAGESVTTLVTNIGALPDDAEVLVRSTAGSATMTCTVRLWGYSTIAATWFPLGPGADLTKGYLNNGAAIGESVSGVDSISHAERVRGLFSFDRIYAEILAIGGTSTAITVEVLIPPAGRA
jgi:hypothetical protein